MKGRDELAVAEVLTDRGKGSTSKDRYVGVVKQTLRDLLGDSAASAAIYHLGGDGALQDPEAFEKGLKAFFGPGAETIMKVIQKNLRLHQEAEEMEKRSNN